MKGVMYMDKDTFFNLTPAKRVQEVNKLLKKHTLKEISSILEVSSGKLSSIMREGDYLYHQADKQYYPFVHSEEERVTSQNMDGNKESAFIKDNLVTLEKIVHQFEEQGLLYLDKRIYSKDSKYVNKSIRMNNDIYSDFTRFCEEFYPHLKNQDLIAQALLDAMSRYMPEHEREQ